jgi:hypothetical protein
MEILKLLNLFLTHLLLVANDLVYPLFNFELIKQNAFLYFEVFEVNKKLNFLNLKKT